MLSLANEGTARGENIVNFASLMVIPLSNLEELLYQTDLGHLDTLLTAFIPSG